MPFMQKVEWAFVYLLRYLLVWRFVRSVHSGLFCRDWPFPWVLQGVKSSRLLWQRA